MEDEDDGKAFRAYIECDGCGQRNPSHKCSRCKCVFYCSVDCQRQHWIGQHKKECVPIDKRVPVIPPVEESLVTPLNSECGICLEDPIKQPVVLPRCRHAFCFSCLSNWQGDCSDCPQNEVYKQLGQAEKITKFCPFCRKKIGKSVARTALIRARRYQTQAQRLDQSADESERMKLLHLAVSECDMILEADPDDVDAMAIKVRALAQFDPSETIVVAKRLLHLHEEVGQTIRGLQAQIAVMSAALDAGNEEEAKRLYVEMMASYGDKPWPRNLGGSPDAAFPVRVIMAKAYEELSQFPDAFREYNKMMKWYQVYEDRTGTGTVEKTSQAALDCWRDATMGYSRCMLYLGDFDKALCSGQNALRMGRHSAGTHMLVAKAQRALARPPPVTAHSLAGKNNQLTSTMTDAVETMYRGVVYETPWDTENRRVNREFLQELLGEIVINGTVEAVTVA
jgi:tetratricopeptide (TPR) repeat protein